MTKLNNHLTILANVGRLGAKSKLREQQVDNCWATLGQLRPELAGLAGGNVPAHVVSNFSATFWPLYDRCQNRPLRGRRHRNYTMHEAHTQHPTRGAPLFAPDSALHRDPRRPDVSKLRTLRKPRLRDGPCLGRTCACPPNYSKQALRYTIGMARCHESEIMATRGTGLTRRHKPNGCIGLVCKGAAPLTQLELSLRHILCPAAAGHPSKIIRHP